MKKILIEFNGTDEEYNYFKDYIRTKFHAAKIIDEDLAEDVIQIMELRIEQGKRQVMLKDKRMNLTAREFDILCFLARHPGQVFSHQEIYEEVWQNEYFHDVANITAHIGHIRKKIEPNPRKPIYILTVHGVGYKFTKIT